MYLSGKHSGEDILDHFQLLYHGTLTNWDSQVRRLGYNSVFDIFLSTKHPRGPKSAVCGRLLNFTVRRNFFYFLVIRIIRLIIFRVTICVSVWTRIVCAVCR